MADKDPERVALEAIAMYAVGCESVNSDQWMEGLQKRIADLLRAKGSRKVCTYDGRQFRLRDPQGQRP